MTLSRSYSVLRITSKRISEIPNLLFYNAWTSSNSCRNFTTKSDEEKVSNQILDECDSLKNVTPNCTRGYADVSKSESSGTNSVSSKSNENVTETETPTKSDLTRLILDEYDCDFTNENVSRILDEHYTKQNSTLPFQRDRDFKHKNANISEASNRYNSKLATTILNKYNYRSNNASRNVNKNVAESLNNSNLEKTITLLDRPSDLDLNNAMKDLDKELPGPLDKCNEDLSYIGPYTNATFNFAKFADDSFTIQQLVKLGVELYKLEKDREVVEMFLSLDFDKDIKPYITFLKDCGVQPENLGRFITKNPKIFKEDMDDLRTRIRYLMAHNFTPAMIQNIGTFKLNGYKIRNLTTKCPKLITYSMMHIRESTFCVKEEMGFNLEEMSSILLATPRVWMQSRSRVLASFDYIHNQMNIPHNLLCTQSQGLTCRKSRLHQRHQFLVELKRNQYDPTKPLYIPLTSVISGTDIEFCKNVAKASIDTYNLFLKTL
ncbi:mitochondrial transcription termination factor 3 isoform X2 [Lasioglossum baleicum]|uniref:mitochondrial transcription termination factor 3 isoform X2 n=1 Tax=Lasioglossum baleicum TaxID=434251 RepID=UPI003FCEADF4